MGADVGFLRATPSFWIYRTWVCFFDVFSVSDASNALQARVGLFHGLKRTPLLFSPFGSNSKCI